MNTKTLWLITTGVIALTVYGSVQLQQEAGELRGELAALKGEREKLTDELHRREARRRMQDEQEKQLGQALAASASPTPGQQRMLKLGQAMRAFAVAQKEKTAPAESSDDGELLVQGKAGKIYFPELLGDPDYAKAAQTIERQQIAITYGRFLATLNLDPAGRAKLEDMMLQREMAKQNIIGLDQDSDNDTSRQDRAVATREWKTSVRAAFGQPVVQHLTAYDQTLRLQNVVDDLETRMSYTAAPVQSTQSDQLFRTLVATAGTKVTTRYWTIPDAALVQAERTMSPAQVETLKQIREEQQGIIDAHNAKQAPAEPEIPSQP